MSSIVFELDGQQVEAAPGETLWAVAQRLGTHIPHLCHKPDPGYRAEDRQHEFALGRVCVQRGIVDEFQVNTFCVELCDEP